MKEKDLEELVNETKTPLEYESLKEYYYGNNKHEGQQWIFRFKNGYGASVIKHFGSYGFEADLFELAVIKFNDMDSNNEWDLCYDTPITDNVIGWLSNENVIEYLERIKEL